LGVLAALHGQWGAGERHLRAPFDLDPLSPDAHNTLGSLYLRKGDLNQAVAEFREALRLRPNSASICYNLGLAFPKQNKDDEAANEFHRALAIDSRFRPEREALRRLAAPPK